MKTQVYWEQQVGFVGMLLRISGATLLESMLASKGTTRAGVDF